MVVHKDNLTDEMEFWENKLENAMIAFGWIFIIYNCILTVASIVALIQVVFQRKRREYFTVLTLTFYLVSSALSAIITIR